MKRVIESTHTRSPDDCRENDSTKCVFAWSLNEIENVVVVGRVYKYNGFFLLLDINWRLFLLLLLPLLLANNIFPNVIFLLLCLSFGQRARLSLLSITINKVSWCVTHSTKSFTLHEQEHNQHHRTFHSKNQKIWKQTLKSIISKSVTSQWKHHFSLTFFSVHPLLAIHFIH